MEAKDVRFKILINNSETQLIKKNFLYVTVCAYSLQNKLVLKKIIFLLNYFEFFLSKLIVLPWIRIQIGPKSWIRIQIQCIWIHNTAHTKSSPVF